MPTEGEFSRLFVLAVLFRVALSAIPMGLAFAGAGLGRAVGGDWAPFLCACAGIGLGIALAVPVKRRWDPLDRPLKDAA